MKSFNQWLEDCENIHNKDYENLNESKNSRSRFLNNLKTHNMIVVMSVDRNPYRLNDDGSYPDQQTIDSRIYDNHRANIGFKNTLKHHQAYFIPVIGEYNEEDPVTKKSTPVSEHSFVIFISNDDFGNEILDTCIRNAKKYNQDSILIASKDEGYFYYTRECNDHSEGDFESIGNFHITRVEDYFSEFGQSDAVRKVKNSFYYNKGNKKKTNKINRSFEFSGFPNDKVSKFLNENVVDFECYW